jgi:hypothetical protein
MQPPTQIALEIPEQLTPPKILTPSNHSLYQSHQVNSQSELRSCFAGPQIAPRPDFVPRPFGSCGSELRGAVSCQAHYSNDSVMLSLNSFNDPPRAQFPTSVLSFIYPSPRCIAAEPTTSIAVAMPPASEAAVKSRSPVLPGWLLVPLGRGPTGRTPHC